MKTLNYVRVAHKAKDGANGFVYLHHFGTGWEELIFSTHEHAARYKAKHELK